MTESRCLGWPGASNGYDHRVWAHLSAHGRSHAAPKIGHHYEVREPMREQVGGWEPSTGWPGWTGGLFVRSQVTVRAARTAACLTWVASSVGDSDRSFPLILARTTDAGIRGGCPLTAPEAVGSIAVQSRGSLPSPRRSVAVKLLKVAGWPSHVDYLMILSAATITNMSIADAMVAQIAPNMFTRPKLSEFHESSRPRTVRPAANSAGRATIEYMGMVF